MPSCFCCISHFPTLKLLLLHYKLIHKFVDTSEYNCNEKDCNRAFPSLNSFKKHFKNAHFNDIYETIDDIIQSPSVNALITNESVSSSSLPTTGIVMPSDTAQNNNVDLSPFKELFSQRVLLFVSELYDNNYLPRNVVQKVIDGFEECIALPIHYLREQISSTSFANLSQRKTMLDICAMIENMFHAVKSEHFRFKSLTSAEMYIKPVDITVGQHLVLNSEGVMQTKPLTCQYISITSVLSKFFEMENVYDKCFEYYRNEITSDTSNYVSSILNGRLWKNKLKNTEDIIFPLCLFYDDFEVGNPLGSRASVHKLGAIYFSTPVIPPKHRGQLHNIFLSMLFHSSDLKMFGTKMLFSKLVDELQNLETFGIFIKVKNNVINVKCPLILIQGDNLGLNTILGFSQCFRSNYYCRFCKMHKEVTEKQVRPQKQNIRNKDNYKADVATNDVKITGIKEVCVFNALNSFHVTDNLVADIMHDLFEGVCKYVMAGILYDYVYIRKIITIDNLNFKLRFFPLCFEEGNRPPSLSDNNIKNKQMKLSASEMLCLCRYFCIIIGNLVLKTDKHWKLYCLLRTIISITTSPKLTIAQVEDLEQAICQHHTLYLRLFPEALLCPKFHFITHLPDIIRQTGPPIHLWSMRYEAKHKSLKSIANSVSTRVNISKTLAQKHQLGLCHTFIANKVFIEDIKLGKSVSLHVQNLPISEQLKTALAQSGCSDILRTTFLTVAGTIYRVDYMILIHVENLPVFGKILYILSSNNEIYFIYKKHTSVLYDYHFQSYELKESDEINFIKQNELDYVSPVLFTVLDNKKIYATLRHTC